MTKIVTLEDVRAKRIKEAVDSFSELERHIGAFKGLLMGFTEYADMALRTPRGRRRYLAALRATIDLFDLDLD